MAGILKKEYEAIAKLNPSDPLEEQRFRIKETYEARRVTETSIEDLEQEKVELQARMVEIDAEIVELEKLPLP